MLDAILGGSAPQGAAQGASSGLGDLLGQASSQLQAGMREGAAGKPVGSGSFASVIGQILGTATSGVQEAARNVEAQTGIASKADQTFKQATGTSAGELWAKARDLVGQNQIATGAALSGLAALLLGTGTGRNIAASTAKLGGLAVIGGLAYKALENYRAGKPIIDIGSGVQAAPQDSPFGETADKAADQQTALLIVRTIIAAAAADGVIDPAERQHIVGGLSRTGIGAAEAEFLDSEFAKPLTVDALVAQVSSPTIAAEVYTAARLAINPDNDAEIDFLAKLASGLKLDPALVAHLDAAVGSDKS
ncbi:MAG: tellurite resistance TerB family protein [Methylacidiphilales bacterium]|nr:tellurite resistance TerB family protein [Candidatus Methylacidiphilales bacterium]